MKSLFICAILIITGVIGNAVEKENSAEAIGPASNVTVADFLDRVGLQPGSYELIKESDKEQRCTEGSLSVVEVDNTLTIMLGARALITSLGPKDNVFFETESHDESTPPQTLRTKTIYRKNYMWGLSELYYDETPDKKFGYEVTITINDNLIKYEKTDFLGATKKNQKYKCAVRKK